MSKNNSEVDEEGKIKHLDVAWSTSRADTAEQCLFKYSSTYVHKIQVPQTHALAFGSAAHDIQAKILEAGLDLKQAMDYMDSKKDLDPELYKLLPYMVTYGENQRKIESKYGVDFKVENKYGLTKAHDSTTFFAKDVYIRLVIDSWAYDNKTGKLFIVDHKTNKSASGPKAVKEHKQLNLYAWALMKMNNYDLKDAHIALNFLRHNKLVWAKLSRYEIENFGRQYLDYLSMLEDRVNEAYQQDYWPKERGFYCRWCNFRHICEASQNK